MKFPLFVGIVAILAFAILALCGDGVFWWLLFTGIVAIGFAIGWSASRAER